MSMELYRVKAADLAAASCANCQQPLSEDPIWAHKSGEAHPMHEGCWKDLAKNTPGGERQVICLSCASPVDTTPLFSWAEKIKQLSSFTFKQAVKALEGAMVGAQAGTMIGLGGLVGEMSGEFALRHAIRTGWTEMRTAVMGATFLSAIAAITPLALGTRMSPPLQALLVTGLFTLTHGYAEAETMTNDSAVSRIKTLASFFLPTLPFVIYSAIELKNEKAILAGVITGLFLTIYPYLPNAFVDKSSEALLYFL